MVTPASVLVTASSAAVRSGPGMLVSVLVTAGADAASVTIYDNTAGSGTVLGVVKAAANTSASWSPSQPIACGIGLYATVTGTTPSVAVAYL